MARSDGCAPYLCPCTHEQLCLTLCDPTDCSPPGSSVYGICQTGVGCHFLLQGILLTQGSNPRLLCLLYFMEILYPLSQLLI